MRIVIIEDEKIIAKDLAATLKSVDAEIEIVKILSSVNLAVQFLKESHDIDLIFSDIQLGDGLSFEIFQQVTIDTPIIFCTAYNEYALDAFNTNGIDYILKPFSEASVSKALSKYHILKEKFAIQTAASSVPNNDYTAIIKMMEAQLAPKPKSIIVKKGERFIPIGFDKIALFYIEDNYTFAHTFDPKRYLVSQKLEQLENDAGNSFYRANRQFLVNRKAIRDAAQYFNRKLLLNLTFDFKEKITVGKVKGTDFLTWLAG